MKTSMIYMIYLALVLSLMGPVQAATVTWTGRINSDWLNPDNWDLARIPESGDTARFRRDLPGAVIDAPGPECERLDIGHNENGDLTIVDGGILDVTGGNNDINIGRGGAKGTLNVFGGTITISRDLDISDQANSEGVVNMSGGTMNIGDDLELPNIAGNTGTLTMTGGTINIADNLDMLEAGPVKLHLYGGTINVGGDLQLDDPGEFDLGGGTLVIYGNAVATVQGFIDDGYIIAYDANGTVLPVDYDTNKDQTTLKALHKFNPIPADRSIVTPGTVLLEWTVDAGTQVDVWFSDDVDKVYAGDLDALVVDKTTASSVAVEAEGKKRYYWAVDTYVPGVKDPIYGHIFGFLADNAPPVVNAGANETVWLDNGSVEVTLSGTVDDTDPTSNLWTVTAYDPNDPNDPNELLPNNGSAPAVIADPAQLETTITINAVGTYELKLTADDGEYQSEDTMLIYVFSDSCQAAQSLEGFEFNVADINQDCIVDDFDMAIMLENWMKSSCIVCPDPNNP